MLNEILFSSIFNLTNSTIHQALIGNGTQWVNADIDHVYILNKGTTTHAQIDTFIGLFNITSPSNSQVLKYAKSLSKWINVNDAHTLASLNDVLINSPSNTQVLTYNSSSSKWINSTPVTQLSSLSDCAISAPSNIQLLQHNTVSSKWVNSTITLTTSLFSLSIVRYQHQHQVIC